MSSRSSASVNSVWSHNLELMTLSSDIVSAHACVAAHAAPPLVSVSQSRALPGRLDSHVTSNMLPRCRSVACATAVYRVGMIVGMA